MISDKTYKCQWCGTEFQRTTKGQPTRYCCQEHLILARNERSKTRARAKREADFIPHNRKCITCGDEYEYICNKSSEWFCSKECEWVRILPCYCEMCGKGFRYESKNYNRFCSKSCASKYLNLYTDKRRPFPKALSKAPMRLSFQCICEMCGKPFITANETKTTCSKECSYQLSLAKLREENKQRYEAINIVCDECGTVFHPALKNGSRARFCSSVCLSKHNSKEQKYKRRNAFVDGDITLKKVAELDKDICYLCGVLVNWHDKTTKDNRIICGNYYPSIEHVLPISKDGKHCWSNVRLAHRICNARKGAKIFV